MALFLMIGFATAGIVLYASLWLYSLKKESNEVMRLFHIEE